MTLGGSGMSLDMCGILGAWMLLLVACGAIKGVKVKREGKNLSTTVVERKKCVLNREEGGRSRVPRGSSRAGEEEEVDAK